MQNDEMPSAGQEDILGREGLHEEAAAAGQDAERLVSQTTLGGQQSCSYSITKGDGGYVLNNWDGPGRQPIICTSFDDVVERLRVLFNEPPC